MIMYGTGHHEKEYFDAGCKRFEIEKAQKTLF